MSPQEPGDIGIEDRRIPMVREVHDRASRIASDPGKAPQLLQRLRKGAAGPIRDVQRRAVQPPTPNLVPQRVSDRLHRGERRPRQRGNRGIPTKEPFVHRQHAGDLRLVREHLGNQDGVGVAGASPGQVAPAHGVPVEHPPLEGPAPAPGNHAGHDLPTGRKLAGANGLYTRKSRDPGKWTTW